MKILWVLFAIFLVNACAVQSGAQDILKGYAHLFTPVPRYTIFYTEDRIVVDGIPEETSWGKAVWSTPFQNLDGEPEPQPTYQTRFKMLWDKQNLYILAELEEPHIWTYYTNHDQMVYLENALVILIDKDRSTHNYFGLDINAQNTVYDGYHTMPPRNGGRERIDWHVNGLQSAVKVHGTINNPADIDEKWVVEIAIPFRALTLDETYQVPSDNNLWKMNFIRIEWPTEVINGNYQKKNRPGISKIPDQRDYYLYAYNWVWSPHGIGNLFYPERWGLVKFSRQTVGSGEIEFDLPEEEVWAKYVWLVYYKQQNHRRQVGSYAQTLSELDITQVVTNERGQKALLKQEVRGSSFTVTLQTQRGFRISVNQSGLFQIQSAVVRD